MSCTCVQSGASPGLPLPATKPDAPPLAGPPNDAKKTSKVEPKSEPAPTSEKQARDGQKYLRPVSGPITSKWGSSSSIRGGAHTGVDFGASAGTPIRAAADGVVHSAGTAGAFGKETIIRHPDGRYTQYAHQSRFAPGIKEGAAVKRGDVIGYVGTTGNTSGAHLHFEVRKAPGFERNVNDVNPMPFLEK